jgi:hypothetical protein
MRDESRLFEYVKTNPHSYKRTIELQHPKYANITKSEQRAHGYGNVNITDPGVCRNFRESMPDENRVLESAAFFEDQCETKTDYSNFQGNG